jgi:hypothetical protein
MAENSNTPRVGRDTTPVPTPTPKPSPTPAPALGGIFGTINSRIKSTLPDVDVTVDITIDEFLDTLKETQRRVIGDMLRRAGYGIKKLEDIDTAISEDFSGLPVGSFNQFLTALDSQLVYKKGRGTGPSESVSITKYGPEQIDAWVDSWLTGEVGRTLESVTPEQAKLLRRAVRDYASSESVTKVTKDKKGRAVTTYSPGVSEAGVQEALKTTAEDVFAPEMERRQAFEFSDLLSKTLGIGSI